MTGILTIALVVFVLLVWALVYRLIEKNRYLGRAKMATRNLPQYGIRDDRTGIVEIKSTQASSLNDPRWVNGPFTTVMRLVDKNGNPMPGEQGKWRLDFFPDP